MRKVDGVDTGGGGGDFAQIWFHRFIHFLLAGKKIGGKKIGGKNIWREKIGGKKFDQKFEILTYFLLLKNVPYFCVSFWSKLTNSPGQILQPFFTM